MLKIQTIPEIAAGSHSEAELRLAAVSAVLEVPSQEISPRDEIIQVPAPNVPLINQ